MNAVQATLETAILLKIGVKEMLALHHIHQHAPLNAGKFEKVSQQERGKLLILRKKGLIRQVHAISEDWTWPDYVLTQRAKDALNAIPATPSGPASADTQKIP